MENKNSKKLEKLEKIKKLEKSVKLIKPKGPKIVSTPKTWDDEAIYVLSKLILESIKSTDELNVTTSKYSKILIGLTIIMTVAVLVQVGLFFID